MTGLDLPPGTKPIDHLESLVAHMGGLAEDLCGEAIDAVARRDCGLAEDLVRRDERIDEMELEIERLAVQWLAEGKPVDRELRATLAAIKIASDLERIGDMAKNVAKRAQVVSRAEPLRVTNSVVRLGRRALEQLSAVLNAYARADAEQAMAVWRRDEDIDELYNSLFRELLTYMMEDPRTIGLCTHLLFVAKNLERVGDHATNIAEIIYYLVHGTYVRDERPKGDTTSVTSVAFGQQDGGG